MQMPILTVIIPVYNAEKYLPKCLNSLANQTYKNLEIIFVDDGSTDNSGAICDQYCKKDNRARAIHQENRGVVAAREQALHAAKGEYVTFLDADDWIDKNVYEKMMKGAVESGADIVVSGYVVESESGKIRKNFTYGRARIYNAEDGWNAMCSYRYFGWELCDKIYKREIISKIRVPYNVIRGEDFLQNYKAAKIIKEILYLPIYGYHYVQRSTSVTKNMMTSLEGLSSHAIHIADSDPNIWAREHLQGKEYVCAKMRMYISSLKRLLLMGAWDEKSSAEFLLEQSYIRKKLWRIFFMKSFPRTKKIGGLFFSLPFFVVKKLRFFIVKYDTRRINNITK